VRVVEQLVQEFPTLRPQLPSFREQIAQLARNREYHESLYSRTITPKAFRRFDVCPEFRTIGQILLGYTPAAAAAR